MDVPTKKPNRFPPPRPAAPSVWARGVAERQAPSAAWARGAFHGCRGYPKIPQNGWWWLMRVILMANNDGSRWSRWLMMVNDVIHNDMFALFSHSHGGTAKIWNPINPISKWMITSGGFHSHGDTPSHNPFSSDSPWNKPSSYLGILMDWTAPSSLSENWNWG